MQQQMEAIVFRRFGPAEVLERARLPLPQIGAETVLVRVAAAALNPADWVIRSGQLRLFTWSKLPFVPGADIAGVVEAVGPAVRSFAPGDAVYAMLPNLDGGGYAQFAAVPERNLTRVPANLSYVDAAAVPLAGLTALQALRDQGRLQPGAQVLVNGASGGVGTFGVQIAKVLGAQVTATCSGRNIELVRSLGADEVLDYTTQEIGGGRYDLIFDAVGLRSFGAWRRALRPSGTVVTVNPVLGNPVLRGLARLSGRQRLTAVFVQSNGADLALISEWISAGRVRPVIDRCYALDEAATAQRYSETKRARGKIVLVVDEQLAASRGGLPLGQPLQRQSAASAGPAHAREIDEAAELTHR